MQIYYDFAAGCLRWLRVSSNGCWWHCLVAAGRSYMLDGKELLFGWFGGLKLVEHGIPFIYHLYPLC